MKQGADLCDGGLQINEIETPGRSTTALFDWVRRIERTEAPADTREAFENRNQVDVRKISEEWITDLVDGSRMLLAVERQPLPHPVTDGHRRERETVIA